MTVRVRPIHTHFYIEHNPLGSKSECFGTNTVNHLQRVPFKAHQEVSIHLGKFGLIQPETPQTAAARVDTH